jgi:sugar phosphate isomerase/epimerase
MRFGIEQMQPSLLMRHVRAALATSEQIDVTSLDVDVAAQVQHLAGLGFHLIELNPDLAIFFPRCYNLPTIERLAEWKAQRQLQYTVHLPLWSLEPSTPVQMVRQGSVDTLVDAVLRLAPLEPEVYVLHATGSLAAEFALMKAVEPMRPLVLSLFAAQARRSIKELLERTGLPSRLLAIENIEFPFELTLQLARTLDLSMCLDTGHILAGYTTGVSLLEALDEMLPRLAEIHLHDGYRRDLPGDAVQIADHLPLGAGELPWETFLDAVDESGFSGPIIFELTVEEAQASLETIRALRPEWVSPE